MDMQIHSIQIRWMAKMSLPPTRELLSAGLSGAEVIRAGQQQKADSFPSPSLAFLPQVLREGITKGALPFSSQRML